MALDENIEKLELFTKILFSGFFLFFFFPYNMP